MLNLRTIVSKIFPSRQKAYILCFISGFTLALAFSSFNCWILSWVSFIPLFFAISRRNKLETFLLSYLCGLIFWSSTIYWLVHVTLMGQILLIMYLAIYFGIFGLWFNYFYNERKGFFSLIILSSYWVILEYVRSHLFTGFGWALLGYSQYLNLPAIQIADITGVWGVSFVIILFNILLYSILDRTSDRFFMLKGKILIILIMSIVFGYGCFKIFSSRRFHNSGSKISIGVVQANIPQELKWEEASRDYILDKYFKLSGSLSLEEKADLMVWPEAALPGVVDLDRDNKTIGEVSSFLLKKANIPLVAGAVVVDRGIYFNSALLFDRKGRITERYYKLHLVPFGEYIPLKNILPFLETIVPIGDVQKGNVYTIFNVYDKQNKKEIPFAVLICFEDIFPEISREFSSRGAQFLINITNDAWYKETSAPYQHLQASVFRAIENHLYLVRCANTGISAFINPNGRIVSAVKSDTGKDIFIDGWVIDSIEVHEQGNTFYMRWGDVFIMVCALLCFMGMFVYRRRNT